MIFPEIKFRGNTDTVNSSENSNNSSVNFRNNGEHISKIST